MDILRLVEELRSLEKCCPVGCTARKRRFEIYDQILAELNLEHCGVQLQTSHSGDIIFDEVKRK